MFTIGEEREKDSKHLYYLPPEVIIQNVYSTKADIWSLGCLVIEVVTGKIVKHRYKPLKALFRTATAEPPTLKKTKEYWSYTLRDFIAKCLQPDPEKRATAEELLDDPFVKQASRDTLGTRISSVFLNDMLSDPNIKRSRQMPGQPAASALSFI